MSNISFQEKLRLKSMSIFEYHLDQEGYQKIGGVDEAGRGPLAGPVVAAVAILPPNYLLQDLNDSKKIEKEKRKKLFLKLTNDKDVCYSVGIVDAKKIDQINILQASLLAMKLAVEDMRTKPDYLLVDGKMLPDVSYPKEAIVQGDSLSVSIAAASVIAKCIRDEIMDEYHKRWPRYGFCFHKGYGTKKHIESLQLYGPCPIHRKSFEPIKSLLARKKKPFVQSDMTKIS